GAIGIAAAADRAETARLISDTDVVAAALAEGEEMYKWVGEAFHNGLPRSGTMGPEGLARMARAGAERSRLPGKSDVQLGGRAGGRSVRLRGGVPAGVVPVAAHGSFAGRGGRAPRR